MIKNIFTMAVLLMAFIAQAQNVGVGTTNPQATLDVAGTVRIGASNAAPVKGTIRWNDSKADFEGFNGIAWVSLTGGKGGWGSQVTYVHENDATTNVLNYSNGNYGRGLGNAIAAWGTMAVAGASYDNRNSVLAAGSAHLMQQTASGWVMKGALLPPAGYSSNDQFGWSVAMTANRIAVGAPYFRTNNVRKGGAFVYSYTTTGTGEPTALTASDGAAEDEFGYSVALEGDYLIAGARSAYIGAAKYQGKAYIFKNTNGTWAQQALLTASGGAAEDQFGFAVALSGHTAAVGAPFADPNNVFSAGKVYIFQHTNTQWVQSTIITPPGLPKNQAFGWSLSLKGDTLVVGATDWNDFSHMQAKVYVYVRSGTAWNLQATLEPSDRQPRDQYGCSVQYLQGRIIVGSLGSVGASIGQGKAYIYKLTGNTWIEEAILTASNGAFADSFGSAGVLTENAALVGAPNAEVYYRPGNGRVYFFKR